LALAFWPWLCTKRNTCLLLTEEPIENIVLGCEPSNINLVIFDSLMFSRLHNYSRLLTIIGLSVEAILGVVKSQGGCVAHLVQIAKESVWGFEMVALTGTNQ